MFFCSVNDFSTTRRPIHANFCMQAYSGSGCVFFWGLAPPPPGKGRNEIFVTIGVNGECLHFGGFWAISQQCVDGSTNVCRRAPSPSAVHRPLGVGGGGVKNSKNGGWSHSCCGQLPFLFFSTLPNVVQYVGHKPCAHSDVEPSRSAKANLQGGPKSSKKFRFFHHFETLSPYIS